MCKHLLKLKPNIKQHKKTERRKQQTSANPNKKRNKMLINKWKTFVNHKKVKNIFFIVICCCISFIKCENLVEEYDGNSGLYSIEGKVYAPEIYSANDFNWQRDTVITINNGEYSGFLKEDGTFVISGIPSGSYVVEVSNPDYYYESVSHGA